jgi:membrane-bound serine protease (ClpP class)
MYFYGMITDMRRFLFRAIAFFGSVFLVVGAMAQMSTDSSQIRKVYRFKIHDEIAAPALHILKRAMEEAKTIDADILFMELDTYGGRVDIADSMRTRLLRSEIPVFVLIDNNAASAGALISIACDSIYMTPGSTIGAATVVNQSGETGSG